MAGSHRRATNAAAAGAAIHFNADVRALRLWKPPERSDLAAGTEPDCRRERRIPLLDVNERRNSRSGDSVQGLPTDGKPPIVLYNFDTVHGAGPQSGLTRGSDGNFYGTTYGGGKYGVGEIFSISPSGALTDLWDFRNGAVIPAPVGRLPTDQEKLDAAGSYPLSAPVQGSDGNWYGVTSYANNQQWGVVYQLSGGTYRGLYQFKPADVATIGNLPDSLSAGHDGNFYGTTLKGGLGWGTIYRVSGGGVSVIHQFDANGAGSISVIQGRDGRLFGTASGPNTSFGEVYRLAPNTGEFTVIHKFVGTDGAGPVAGLTEGKDGFLYGVTKYGGLNARGVIYRMYPDGTAFSVLFNLDMNNGRYDIAPLIQHSNGDFYGITYQGGTNDSGVFYHLNLHTYPTPSHDSLYQGGVRATSNTDTMMLVNKDVGAYAIYGLSQAELKYNDGVSVRLGCLRNHTLCNSFIEKKWARMESDLGGSYGTSWGTFQLTTDPANPNWHTDAIGIPNGYYDQAPGASHRLDPSAVTIFDQPSLAADNVVFYAGAHETWRATAKDFAICNCKVVRTVTWAREARWNALTGVQGPPTYTNFSIGVPDVTDPAWADKQMQWINTQLQKDGYDPVP